ncbi:hypothetical protein BZA77DRAFT_300128 [Pyronema omphalodes]|nr:hypothetical protein BZA77DRAFT_300128 [Pyronema omphalodes]
MEGWKSPHSQTVWKAHKLSPIPPSPPSSLSSFPGNAFAQSPYSTLGSDSRYGGVEERYVNDYGAYGGDGYDGYDTYSSRGGGGGGGRGMEYTGYDSYDSYTENHYGPATAAAAVSESHYSLTTEDHSYHGGANLELYKSSGSIDSTTALTSSSSSGGKSGVASLPSLPGLSGLATITTIDTSRGIYHPPTLQQLNTEEIQERAELPTAMYDPVELAGNKGETPTSPFYERRFYDVRYGTSRDGGAHDRWSAGSAEGIKRGR